MPKPVDLPLAILECLLVHQKVSETFLKSLAPELIKHKIKVKANPNVCDYLNPLGVDISFIEETDYDKEYLDLILNVKVVATYNEALEHIKKYGSKHTESIITTDLERARHFLKAVDASCVMVNASTRHPDGGVLGLGADIGISTSNLHAYGPMGLKELTTRKFVVLGKGHVRT
jgi:glutamate-5-semialdehyde dehydrogenase